MKKIFLLTIVLLSASCIYANTPDSVYVKGFAINKNYHKNGLHLAWSVDGKDWKTIGGEFSFLKSDYGNWGADKKMFDPELLQNTDGSWECRFFTDSEHTVTGVSSSKNLILWKPQEYFPMKNEKIKNNPDSIFKVSYSFLENLLNHVKITEYNNRLYAETAAQDDERFAGLQSVEVVITPNFAHPKKISENLIGVFFEDINYAADGGLYGELLINRDFEYGGRDWQQYQEGDKYIKMEILTPLHPNNPHYTVLEKGESITNRGFDGIAVRAGEKYDFSVFAQNEKEDKFSVKLLDNQGNNISNEIIINVKSKNWKQYSGILIANKTEKNAKLEIKSLSVTNSQFLIDMMSLFPQKTFKNRKNGLRADLAQAIADLKPRFVRFPGGCVAHGQGIENIYNWKNSIGKLEERKPDFNLWGYHQTKGLGYFEYFQFCEDIGAEPLPIIAAGVPCQNSSLNHKTGLAGQQGGIPLAEMDTYIQDILDLIEWANGDKSTQWGKIRTQAGHPKPFNLKYIGIGNEDLISEVFKERFEMIFNAIKAKHPEITVIGTVGPFYEGSDYEFGWQFASQIGVPMVDEHYYVPPAWLIYNQDFYDNYDRSKPKVYLGEYAAHLAGRPNNVETALAEALHLCNVERNGDIVAMTSYAPLLAKEGHTQWNPDLIYFNNTEVKTTVGYEVQKLFGNNAGDLYIPAAVEFGTLRTTPSQAEKVRARIAQSIVRDTKTGDLIIKMVNLLPIEAKVEFPKVSGFENPILKAEKTVLQGAPADHNAKPISETIDLQENKIILPRYSFTVLRIKTNQYL